MDRLEAMRILLRVAERGSFSAASRDLGVPLATVSRKVNELETHLGARLLVRTTRKVALTDTGEAYLASARRILEDVEETERVASGEFHAPRGELTLTAPVLFGRLHILPIVLDFLAIHPEINVRLLLSDRNLHLLEDHVDMAVRIGELEDSTLRARKLTETTKRMIASPAYFEKYGRPEKIDDLNDHKLLHYSNQSSGNVWKVTAPSGEKRQVRTAGWLSVNDGQSLLNAAVAGLGIAYLPSFLYGEAMEKGLVEDAIPDLPVETQGVYAVYPPGRFTQPKVRAFIDFLVHAFADKGPTDW